ncbi:Cysteine-rich DPF motif domain-containing protein 1, partial [Pseudolycoriella hygida]
RRSSAKNRPTKFYYSKNWIDFRYLNVLKVTASQKKSSDFNINLELLSKFCLFWIEGIVAKFITKLQSMDEPAQEDTSASSQNHAKAKKDEEDEIPKPKFKCENCGLHEEYDYFGKQPPFANKIKFNENCYIMKDPFTAAPEHAKTTNSEYFIALGTICTRCDRQICRGADCSFYYLKTYCLQCAVNNVSLYPLEVQSKIKKQIAMIRTH